MLDVITAVAVHDPVGLVSALTVADRNKRTSTADLLLVIAGFILRHAHAHQCASDGSNSGAKGGASDRRRECTGGDKWADAWDCQGAEPHQPPGESAKQSTRDCAG
jgi:hypothetical protein